MESPQNLNLDSAIKTLYAPKRKGVMERAEPKPPTQHGGFEALFLKKKEQDTTKADDLDKKSMFESSGWNKSTMSPKSAVGAHTAMSCRRKSCLHGKDVDLAELQSKAFKFMVLQRPKVNKATSHLPNTGRICQASFLPRNTLPEELQNAFEYNKVFRQLMQVPDKVMNARKFTGVNAKSRFARTIVDKQEPSDFVRQQARLNSAMVGETTDSKLVDSELGDV